MTELQFEDLGKYILMEKKDWLRVSKWLKKNGINVEHVSHKKLAQEQREED